MSSPPNTVCNQVKIEHKAELVRWLRDTLHPADNTTLHVHFIDYDTPRDLADLDTALSNDQPSTSIDFKKLVKDIKSLSLFTDGVLLSWSGHKTIPARDCREPTKTVLHNTFNKLFQDRNVTDFNKERSLVVTLACVPQGEDGVTKTSPCTRHQLQLMSSDTNLAQVTWQTLITTSVREGDTRPVVCVLVGGDTESLKTAVTAVSNNIPVIVMKGSGGFADLLAWLYHKATLDYKRRRVHGKVQRVTVRVVEGETMKKIRTHFKDQPDIVTSLDELVSNLQLLTVYAPDEATADQSTTDTTDASQDNRNMDAVLLEALIKHNQEAQIDVLLRTMKVQQKLVHVPEHTYSPSVVEPENNKLQLDCFIDSLLGRSPTAVSAFLTHLKPKFFDFHLARLLRLYEADVPFLTDKLTEEDKHKLGEKDRDKPFTRFLQARRNLKSYAGSVSRFPLRCRGVKCKECNISDNGDQKNAKRHSMQATASFLQTCLHPIQELFLWALLSGNMDVTVSLWKHCDDKMAAALFARAVYQGIRKTHTIVDVKKELKDYARRFEDLAVATLKAANEVDEKKTRDLLNKECLWWGGVSVLQLAMLTRSKLFIAQELCRQQLTREWNGHHDQGQPLCPCRSKRRLTPPDPATTTSCHGDKGAACKQAMQRIACYFKRPKSCYWISLVWQIAFLALYSYVLLFDLRDIPSPAFIALMVCVADIAFEEIRQLLTSSMKVGGKKDRLLTRVKAYWSQKWNKLDVFSVAGFVLGVILVFAPNQAAHRVGRVVLAVDVFVFFLRFLQILMVFRELGLLLVMAERMVKDSARFMLILLTVMLGYVVASESVLYPDMHFSWPTLYRLPSRAFGQTFAEIGMQEIQQGDCDKDGLCPSSYGQYVVPVMLAIYVIATHVLLLNLLIARFNATFEAVKMEAERHQAWQYCQLVQEYKNRSLLPPPCNILRLLRDLTWPSACTRCCQCCQTCQSCPSCQCCLCCQRCQCCKYSATPAAGAQNRRQQTSDTGTGTGEGENMILDSQRGKESMKLTPSAWGKCVTISSPQPMKDFTVELRDTNNVFQSRHDYSVPGGTQRVMLWRDDPTLTAALTKLEGADINVSEPIDTSERTTWEDAWQLQKFEHDQALFVRRGPITSDNTQWWSRAATEYQREFLQFLQQRSLFPGALDTERHEV